MADTGEHVTQVKEHEATYGGFTQLMLWGTIVAAGLAAFVVFLIAN